MPKKTNLLIVGDYNRRDFVDLFKACRNDFHFYFLEYASLKEVTANHYLAYGEAIFWKDYSDAYTLLAKVAPQKVVFFFIETYNHVALNVACKQKGITSCLLDHGIRDINLNLAYEATQKVKLQRVKLFNSKVPLLDRIKTRLFFIRSVKKSSLEHKRFLKDFYNIRSRNTYFKTSQILQHSLRKPDVYLAFSVGVYKAHQKLDALAANQKIYYFGIPYFDEFSQIRHIKPKSKHLLFIDQAFVSQHLLGWIENNKRDFIKKLLAVCSSHDYKLIVKIHPLENPSIWREFEGKALEIVVDNFHAVVSTCEIIIGFYSTLLLGLAALPHTTILTYEGHPAGNKFFLSRFLVAEGVGSSFVDMEELGGLLTIIKQIQLLQQEKKKEFIKEWLYRFDGRSGERLRDLLLQEL